MFSGIIQTIGTVDVITQADHGVTLTIRSTLPVSALEHGASVAHNGVCLTVTSCTQDGDAHIHTADVSHETLSRTTLNDWQPGTAINLEPSLKLGDPLDGHLVFGHVDGLGEITGVTKDGGNWIVHIRAPQELLPMIAEKGSISVDGTSLTVNGVEGDKFHLTIIPHTLSHTIIQHYTPGTKIHLEADMLARYVARILEVEK